MISRIHRRWLALCGALKQKRGCFLCKSDIANDSNQTYSYATVIESNSIETQHSAMLTEGHTDHKSCRHSDSSSWAVAFETATFPWSPDNADHANGSWP